MLSRTFFTFGIMWLLATSVSAENQSVRGVVRSLNEATIAVDFSARIAKLPYREGDSFKKGSVLVAFDCSKFAADSNAAHARAKSRKLVYSNNQKLQSRGAIGGNEVDVSAADYDEAAATAQATSARLRDCVFRAPFDGRIVQVAAQVLETPGPAQPIIRIVDSSRVEVEIIVPSKWLAWLKSGQGFTFEVDETGQTAKGQIKRIGATVDPVSQTVKVFGRVEGGASGVLPGMSGTAVFENTGS
jgi:membrane fusion protein, multidrug efflux system